MEQGDFVQRVASAMAAGKRTLDEVARDARTSPRTLQRRLRLEGASFLGLLDAVRCEQAKRMIAGHGVPAGQAAIALGYRDQGSFTRAFRRWTGMSPREFRSRLDASPCEATDGVRVTLADPGIR